MNKRIVSLGLALLMLLALCLPALAEGTAPTQQDVALDAQLGLNAVVSWEGQLLLSGTQLHGWRPGEDSLRMLQDYEDGVWRDQNGLSKTFSPLLVSDGARLYALALDDGLLFSAQLSDAGLSLSSPVRLNTRALMFQEDDHELMRDPLQLQMVQGRLYLLMRSFGPMGMVTSLFSYDAAAGGEGRQHAITGLLQMTAYRDGRLLCLQVEGQGPEMMLAAPRLIDYDPANDTLTDLGHTGKDALGSAGPILWDAGEDMLYLSDGRALYRRDSRGQLSQCATLIPDELGDSFSGQLQLLPDKRLAVVGRRSLALRPADQTVRADQGLTIFNTHMEDDAHRAAMRQMQGMPVRFMDMQAQGAAQQLTQALISGDDQIDIFVINSDGMDLDALMKKGYSADLSSSQALQAHMAGLYPFMAEAGKWEGQMLLVPVGIQARLMSVLPKPAAQAGLPLPESYEALVDYVQQWNDSLYEQQPDLIPMEAINYRMDLFGRVLDQLAAQRTSEQQPFSFQDGKLTALLNKIDQLRTDNIVPAFTPGDVQSMSAAFDLIGGKVPVMAGSFRLDLEMFADSLRGEGQGSYSYGLRNGQAVDVGWPRPLMLGVFADEAPRLGVTLRLMAVNPRSRNLDAAIRYVEAYVAALDAPMRTMLMPGLNEGIEDPDYAQYRENVAEELAMMQRAVAEAEGAQKTEAEAELKQYQAAIAEEEDQNRWLVKPEGIQAYRRLMEGAYVRRHGGLHQMLSGEDMTRLINRYAMGEINLAQFLQEAEGKLRLMLLENL